MSFLFDSSYYEVRKKNGVSPAQNMAAYLGGSAIQTVGDNPVTAYRQLVQQFAKDAAGNAVEPKVAAAEAGAVFRSAPLTAMMSGLWPRLIGVLFKRIPKFGILLGYSYLTGTPMIHMTNSFRACPRGQRIAHAWHLSMHPLPFCAESLSCVILVRRGTYAPW